MVFARHRFVALSLVMPRSPGIVESTSLFQPIIASAVPSDW